MEISTVLIIFIILYVVWNYTPLHCIFNPLGCATQNILGGLNGVTSFFDDIGKGFNRR